MTPKEIKKHKGQLIQLTYESGKDTNIVTGIITASTKYHILFNINNSGKEISLRYEQLKEINKPEKE